MDVSPLPVVRERARARRQLIRWFIPLGLALEVCLAAFVAGLPVAAGIVYLAIEVSR